MTWAANQFRKHLVTGESLESIYSATLSDGSARRRVSIGITDRRLLSVSQAGEFVGIGRDHISSIRSRPRTTLSYRGNDYRLLMCGGALLAILAFIGVTALAPDVLAPILTLVTVGGIAAVEYVRRSNDDTGWAALGDYDGVEIIRQHTSKVNDYIDNRQLLMMVGGFFTILAFIGTVVLVSSVVVPLLMLVTGGGIALIDYAQRHKRDFDGIELVRRHEQEVVVTTVDGRTVRFVTDPEAEINRELNRLPYGDTSETTTITATPS